MRIPKLSVFAAATIALLASALPAAGGDASCCMCGKKVCVLEVSQEEAEVTYFEVESKEICIPGIKLPWSCKRRCGGVRKVCVLKEEKREETVCKYDWSIKTICTTCCQKHGLKTGAHCAQVNRDERVPFEYYTADLDGTAVRIASVQAEEKTPAVREVTKRPFLLSAFGMGSPRESKPETLPSLPSNPNAAPANVAEPAAWASSRRADLR